MGCIIFELNWALVLGIKSSTFPKMKNQPMHTKPNFQATDMALNTDENSHTTQAAAQTLGI